MKNLTIENVMEWGILDVQELEGRIDIANKFDISILDIKNEIENLGMDFTDINSWLYATIELTFYEIINEVEKYTINGNNIEIDSIMDVINDLKNDFNPWINYCDSSFNNCIDDIDLTNEKEKIIEELQGALQE